MYEYVYISNYPQLYVSCEVLPGFAHACLIVAFGHMVLYWFHLMVWKFGRLVFYLFNLCLRIFLQRRLLKIVFREVYLILAQLDLCKFKPFCLTVNSRLVRPHFCDEQKNGAYFLLIPPSETPFNLREDVCTKSYSDDDIVDLSSQLGNSSDSHL